MGQKGLLGSSMGVAGRVPSSGGGSVRGVEGWECSEGVGGASDVASSWSLSLGSEGSSSLWREQGQVVFRI